jgi:hypothetical protein
MGGEPFSSVLSLSLSLFLSLCPCHPVPQVFLALCIVLVFEGLLCLGVYHQPWALGGTLRSCVTPKDMEALLYL